jgi:hypothetical protein
MLDIWCRVSRAILGYRIKRETYRIVFRVDSEERNPYSNDCIG